MTDLDRLSRKLRPEVQPLLDLDEEVLFGRLNSRVLAVQKRSPQALGPTPPAEGRQSLGRRLFMAWSASLYDLLCGGGKADVELRDKLASALKLGKEDAAAFIAAAAVAHLNIGAGVAAVVAAIIVKHIFGPALDVLCQCWKENLEPTGASKVEG